jgi:hypothetical protein
LTVTERQNGFVTNNTSYVVDGGVMRFDLEYMSDTQLIKICSVECGDDGSLNYEDNSELYV